MGFLSFEVLSRLDWLLSILSSPYFYLKLKSRSRFYNLPPHQIQHSLGSLQFLLHIAPTVDVEINLTRSVSLPKHMKTAWEKRGRAWQSIHSQYRWRRRVSPYSLFIRSLWCVLWNGGSNFKGRRVLVCWCVLKPPHSPPSWLVIPRLGHFRCGRQVFHWTCVVNDFEKENFYPQAPV